MQHRSLTRVMFGTCLALLIATLGTAPAFAQDDATPESSGGDALGRNTYTSPGYDFEIKWDPSIWDASLPEVENGEALLLEGAQGSLYIFAADEYDGDPQSCLEGEAAYYEDQDAISDWQLVTNEDDEPLAGNLNNLSYGVYSLTYTDPSDDEAEGIELVDYLECRTLVPGESVMFLLATSTPEFYNDFVRDVLSVTDQIAFADPEVSDEDATPQPTVETTPEPTEEATPVVTEEPTSEATPETAATPEINDEPARLNGLEGSLYTSPSFGYSLEIPSNWTVEDATSEEGNDTLIINNGVSTLTINGTDAFTGDLEGCVDFAFQAVEDDPAFDGIIEDTTANGDPFRGSSETQAYAGYTYVNEEGIKMSHFITCEYLEEGESVLIIIQDVPYDEYSTQRQERIQITSAIERP